MSTTGRRAGLCAATVGRLELVHLMTSAILAAILTAGSASAPVLPSAPGIPAVPPPVASTAYPTDSLYRAPLASLRVVTSFNPPADRYGAGHLGVDMRASAGVAVLAAGAGVVRFAGPVAGRGVVVLVHPDGISTEYEPVAAVVVTGQQVVAGQRIGSVRGSHRGCAPEECLHWGARRGTAYLDPMSLLRPLGVVRLLPWS